MKISPISALAELASSSNPFKVLFEHGSLSVEIYKPVGKDLQQPHTRDEVYVIIAGKASFVHSDSQVEVTAGDFLFVPAGYVHRFENFSDDFSTWVIFYGPEGGEDGR